MEEQNENVRGGLFRRILYWLGVALELLIPLLLTVPPVYALADPTQDLVSIRFLMIESGVCFGGFILAMIAAKIVNRVTTPKGNVSVTSLIRFVNGDTGWMRLSIGLMGAAMVCFAVSMEISLFLWFLLPAALLCFYLALSSVRKERRTAKRILRGEYTLSLAAVTNTEEKTVESCDYGSDGTGYSYHYEYYLFFSDKKIPREEEQQVSKREYNNAYRGKPYYLVVIDRKIMACFAKDDCSLDAELQRRLLVELVSEEEKEAAEKKRQAVEDELLKSVPGAAPRQEYCSYGVSPGDPGEERAPMPGPDERRRAEEMRKKQMAALRIVPPAVTLALILLVLLFRRDSAPGLLPLTLLPLLVELVPLKAHIQKKYGGVPEDPSQPRLITKRSFLLDGALTPGLWTVALLGAFLLLLGAAFWWIGEEGDPELWGPIGSMLAMIFGIPGLILVFVTRGKIRGRKLVLQNHELAILKLPVLRKERVVSSDGGCRLVFPDIDRVSIRKDKGLYASSLSILGGAAVSEQGRIRVYVGAAEYSRASEGDPYCLLLRTSRWGDSELYEACRWDRVRLDSEMARYETDLSELQERFNAGFVK